MCGVVLCAVLVNTSALANFAVGSVAIKRSRQPSDARVVSRSRSLRGEHCRCKQALEPFKR